ncbi:MAG: NAD(P)H-dependent oxidoreductase subunit E, partial [Thiohalomonadaceae bacterium]
MLSEAEREEITQEAARYPERRAACIEALKIVQRHRGFVADEALAEVAALLGMSTAELDGVATFYNQILRCPVGRHLL